jgi:hypothetical protein
MVSKQAIEFTERQYQPLWWIRVPLIIICVIFISLSVLQIAFNKPLWDNPMDNEMLIFITIFVILFSVLFFVSYLKTHINEEGVYIRYFPFQLKYKYYSWESIESAQVIRYNPIKEFGGWGIKTSIFRFKNFRFTYNKNVCYTIYGNKALELSIKGGKRVVIGTQLPNILDETLTKLKKKEG